MLLAATVAQGQIKIAGSVYGGGNAGDTDGNTTVTVRMGDIKEVFGGARMADVKGSAFVNIDGENAPENSYILIDKVYGGNDISGMIGPTAATSAVPQALSQSLITDNKIDGSWNAFVRVSSVRTETTGQAPNTTTNTIQNKVYIGQLFAGGNGDYTYTGDLKDLSAPTLSKAYLEIVGGSIVYAYGGGNNATVTGSTVICVDNPSAVVNSIKAKDGVLDATNGTEQLTTTRFKAMGINTTFSHPSSDEFQIGSFYGGNNKAAMAIRPTWNLKDGKIRNLSSGGNEGPMTSPDGLLLEIKKGSNITVDYVYGGCRKADVKPLDAAGKLVGSIGKLDGYNFPANFAARTLISGGNINNVYGGNDISGKVYFGNAVGIHTSINGDVYGGGNGSYPYTDNDKLKAECKTIYGDFYYGDFMKDNNYTSSVDALNAFRPNAEQVSVRVVGESETKPTIIGGALYVGGNSATLKPKDKTSKAELKIGSYVIADKVFLGNNGENMINADEEQKAGDDVIKNEGVLRTFQRTDLTSDGSLFNSIPMVDTPATPASGDDPAAAAVANQFAQYMEGCALEMEPSVIFDNEDEETDYTYDEYSTFFGSFYCGGNVGSLTKEGKITIDFKHAVVIYDKLVGGCNNAYVPATAYNAEYKGGIIGNPDVVGDTNKDKLVLNLSGLKIQPKRWAVERDNDYNKVLAGGKEQYLLKDADAETGYPGHRYLEWNTQIDGKDCAPITQGTGTAANPIEGTDDDNKRRLVSGNIYGGCCESGVVNGNVIINVNETLVEHDKLFDEVQKNANDGEESLYGSTQLNHSEQHYHILKRHTGVILGQQGMDVLGKALNVFGGGKGAGTEIWGSTTINLNKGYVFQVFGGSEEGVIGKPSTNGTYSFTYTPNIKEPSKTITKKLAYDEAYSCYVNLKGQLPGVSKKETYNEKMPECEFIYGGSFEGPIAGNTVVRLGNGRIFNSFAGSCYADILGHTETYVGYAHTYKSETGQEVQVPYGFPWIRDMVYGGNDLGGSIMQAKDFSSRLRTAQESDDENNPNNFDAGQLVYKKTEAEANNPDVLKASAYVEYRQGRADAIFGGHYGTYDYSDSGDYKDFKTHKPYLDNAFVNFRPTHTTALKNSENNYVNIVYGGSQGYPGDFDSNKMQDRSYVLIDIPQDMENYKNMQVFGAGAWGGLGMKTEVDKNNNNAPILVTSDADEVDRDRKSAIIDLARGQIDAAYGASYKTGFTRRTVVNVPNGSTVQVNNLFGGAYGESLSSRCDAYEANVNYNSSDARVLSAIYGGNNNARRTFYGRVNIDVPVYKTERDKNNALTLATVYGAGYGENTWSQYTEVNLLSGARVLEAYGGGQKGKVINQQSLEKWKTETQTNIQNTWNAWDSDPDKANKPEPEKPAEISLSLGGEYEDLGLTDPLVKSNPLGIGKETDKFNTNVYINAGAVVDVNYVDKWYGPGYDGGYAYAGGLGVSGVDGSGDVYGTTYIGLFGGVVKKDIYAAGTVGSVMNRYVPEKKTVENEEVANPDYFIAKTYAFIEGGTARNVYGGGWQGSVGKHQGETWTVDGKPKYIPAAGSDLSEDVLGEAHVVIGLRQDIRDDQKPDGYPAALTFAKGVPAIERNAYSGGEGGAIFGTAYLTMNNGYIGYRFFDKSESAKLNGDYSHYTTADGFYEEKIDDETHSDGIGKDRLEDCGNVFGGGYDDLSSSDFTRVKMYGGVVRNSLHGGGEIATVGRGKTKATTGVVRDLDVIYKPGKTHVEMYNGHVLRNVFGGGKGYNKLKYGLGNELYTDGYVFGQTEVYIHGGEIGTKDGVAREYGNVFGGGDIGYVYSSGYSSEKTMADKQANKTTGSPGHYYYYDDNGDLTEDCRVVIEPYLQVKPGITWEDGDNTYTTDEDGIGYGGKAYRSYDYVPTSYLNTLGKKTESTNAETGETIKTWPSAWNSLITSEVINNEEVDRGVIIHNGVFGGGNVSSSSDKTYANATTVFGNVTATLNDVYHRDFISIGTEHVGGLYGGGNFSMVDGYRELNISNYGTDYFSLEQQITLATYRTLSNRERAYFKLQYECLATGSFSIVRDGQTITSDTYEKGQKYDEDEYLKLLEKYGSQVESAFKPWGICSIYAGRLLNTIQRADMCGVFGSRMVLQGAKDRVADTKQDVDYTINRVGELSLNKKRSVIPGEEEKDAEHGNYFGIYSVVNYLGNLTSDVHFYDHYEGSVADATNVPYQNRDNFTYYDFKELRHDYNDRNMAKGLHQVALASGVHLEITTENSTEDHKDYGYITGVVELDLINVKNDKIMGGGFVYAKNEHRVPKYYPKKENVILSEYNKMPEEATGKLDEAITYKRFRYSNEETGDWPEAEAFVISGNDADYGGTPKPWQTSGNFIHNEKHIVDDCYPTNNAYDLQAHQQDPAKAYSEAHYWYVKGTVYVYDQVVTAYTGSASAYNKESQLNLTITAASHGQLKLLNVKPNLYAYYMPGTAEGSKVQIGSLYDSQNKPIDKVTVNNEHDTYALNDVITWWDWHQLPARERAYFVPETYVNCVAIEVTEEGKDPKVYEPGEYVMCDADKAATRTLFNSGKIKDAYGNTITDGEGNDIELNDAGFNYIFRSSNNISHDNGYVLTFEMSTPPVWNKYYTIENSENVSDTNPLTNQTGGDGYRTAPTFHPVTTGVYGKQKYKFGDIITKKTYEAYQTYAQTAEITDHLEELYVAKNPVTYKFSYTDENEQTVTKTATANKGTAVPKSKITEWVSGSASDLAEAKLCINTVKLAEGVYLGYGELKTDAEIDALKTQYAKKTTIENEQEVTYTDDQLIAEIDAAMTSAYFCNKPGTFGGQQFETTKNYGAVEAWCALPKSDRQNSDGSDKFIFNRDAFDLLANKDYLKLTGSVGDTKYPKRFIENEELGEVSTQRAFDPVGQKTYSQAVEVEYKAINKNDNTDIISREDYVDLRNDQRYYSRVDLKDAQKIYVATTDFIDNGVPYGTGQIVTQDLYDKFGTTGEVKQSDETLPAGISYYRYETYDEDPYKKAVISEDEYNNVVTDPANDAGGTKLVNQQMKYIIQGDEPVETTNFYVSGESDIFDVSKERIYSVVYQYTYYENEGNNIKKTNELHIVNVHIQMESGVPIIGPLAAPDVVIPGEAVNMRTPDVTIGSYPPLDNGWEIFRGWDDASMNRNGEPYINGVTPVYWYQNGDYYINYYSRNYLGKIYAPKPMPLKVANYHDLDAVMKDKAHHMYVDRPDVDRPSKIYVDNRDCESDANKNELDLLKDFFDLSLIDENAVNTDEDGLITTVKDGSETPANSPFKGHTLLDSHVKGGANLDFILRSDMSPKKYTDWASIGNDTKCFEGNLHGDGYTISGLNNSLFGKLCGSVYNLGVTGSFTGAGVADAGDGYVENCWINTTGAPASGMKAVFNGGTDGSQMDGNRKLLANCYYPSTKGYAAGMATPMSVRDFNNGTVAYNLNGFYLNKRYYDKKIATPHSDQGSEIATPHSDQGSENLGYVEARYGDGDYMYASGRVPTAKDERIFTDADKQEHYYPIWPDDYIYFGQALNYNHLAGRTHQAEPSVINKFAGRIVKTEQGNRVYRAPAYFGNSKTGEAHFNAYAVFAQSMKDDATVEAYKGMTAIDFTGKAQADYQLGTTAATATAEAAFYPPLLDDDGLSDFTNVDLTRNLLVYTGTAAPASAVTNGKVKEKLTDETYQEVNDVYHTVEAVMGSNVRGHWVQQSDNGAYVATCDHFLVDKEAFNAPIGYQFTDDHRMWYQRLPENYAGQKTDANGNVVYDAKSGWEGISLPFKADIVTTNSKGEITHFYGGSSLTPGQSVALHFTGHEYWLRQYEGGAMKSGSTDTFEATFNRPAATGNNNDDKKYTNTFLWDYYYSKQEYDDLNGDKYPGTYYKANDDENATNYGVVNTYEGYPRLANGTPYIIGFPGGRYYEFDLSGSFAARTAKPTVPAKLSAQTITFASAENVSVNISDQEMETGKTSENGYAFVPNYGIKAVTNAFILNADGSSYDKTANSTTVPFRPYFEAAGNSGAPKMTRTIVFSDEQTQLEGNDDDLTGKLGESVDIRAGKRKVIVTSNLRTTTDVRIFNVGGLCIANFDIEPGQTIEHPIYHDGVYVVHVAGGRYRMKLAVR